MKINELFGIEYPVIQGGMANIATGEFAAEISNAGAMGIIGSGGMDADTLRKHIRKAKSLTNKPFGVNLMLMNPDTENMAKVISEERVPLVTTGAGNPSVYVKKWKDAGTKVFPVVSSVALARRLARLGIDGLIAEGCESGGHVGELTTMVLVPQVADAVQALGIPVVAAGGIATGRQLAAAFILGASGVQIGTAFLLSEECPIHESYKNAVVKAKDNGTIVTGRITGHPVRALKNPLSREYVREESRGADPMVLERIMLGALRRAVFDGDVKRGSLMAGQVSGMIGDIRPARMILEQLMREYEEIRTKGI